MTELSGLDNEAFRRLKESHGGYGSWALWKEPDDGKPRNGIGDLTVLDPQQNSTLLSQIHCRYVAVGLNISGTLTNEPFSNFHSQSGNNRDFIIRYCFHGTPAWGCYMTDLLKDFPEKDSSKVVRYFREHPKHVLAHTEVFKKEVEDIKESFGVDFEPVFLCFGAAVSDTVRSYIKQTGKGEMVRLRHYSDYKFNKERHREEFLQAMGW